VRFQAAIVYAQADRLEYVKMLLEAGSEVNHRDEANHNSMLNLLTRSKKGGRRISCSGANSVDKVTKIQLVPSAVLIHLQG
jgi:hypothetical protein